MNIYIQELDMAGLFHGGTTAAAQSRWLRLNGDTFKNVGTNFPDDRPAKVAEDVAAVLKRDRQIELKREAFRTLKELIKVGQGLEKERVTKLAFRTSGRKAASNKPVREVGDIPLADARLEEQPIPVPKSPIEPPASPPSPIASPAIEIRPELKTYVRSDISADNPLKAVLISYAKKADIAELKRALSLVVVDWRTVDMPKDCRAALEWVDGQ